MWHSVLISVNPESWMIPASISSWHSTCITRFDKDQTGVSSVPKAKWWVLDVLYHLTVILAHSPASPSPMHLYFIPPFLWNFLLFDSKSNELCLVKNENLILTPCFAFCPCLIEHDFLSIWRRHRVGSEEYVDPPALLMVSIWLWRHLETEMLL